MKDLPKILLATVALLISFPQLSSAQWAQTGGPEADWVSALAVSGTNLFAGTGKGVFLSTDSGASWREVNSGLDCLEVRCLAVSGGNLFAGTNWFDAPPALQLSIGGVFLSADNGQNWVPANSGLPVNTDIRSFAVSGTNLFVGAMGDLDYEVSGGLFLSTDRGKKWTLVKADDTLSLAASGSTLFAGSGSLSVMMGEASLSASADNGRSWTRADSGLSGYVSRLAASGRNLFAGTDKGVFRSTDNGKSWTGAGSGLPAKSQVKCFAASGPNMFAGTATGVFLFAEGGDGWKAVSTGFPANTTVWSLAVSGSNLFAGTQGAGVWRIPLKDAIR